ncbi:hypothetical protein A3K71_06330 [archaeon RBG_16_50_20]|nr:MAG: hypothetical protein A3K71_06330 [archaeon RBG_16_50_20]
MSEISSRRIYYLAAVAIVAIVLISAVATTRPLSIQTNGPSSTQQKTLQVMGVGTVSAQPDQAIILLAVQTQAATATQASSDNALIMSKVMDALANVGIGKSSIETVSYSLAPIYEYKQDQTTPPKIVGYAVRNAIQVAVTDFSLVGKALDAAINAGVNEVQGVMFTLSNAALTKIEKQALQFAIQDADGKAKAVASSLGVTLLGPISVTPGYFYQPMFEKASISGNQTPIQPGTLQVTVNVQITYQIA